MLQLYNNIKERRKYLGLTQEELAKKLGYSGKSMIAKIEAGQVDLSQSKIRAFANALNVSPGWLLGLDGIDQNKGVEIPILGRVAAGIPIEQIVDIIDTEEIPDDLAKTGKFFGLQIHGDSMSPNICDGDYVIVRQQPDAESGETVIVTINGDDATCKRLRKYKGGIELFSNRHLPPLSAL